MVLLVTLLNPWQDSRQLILDYLGQLLLLLFGELVGQSKLVNYCHGAVAFEDYQLGDHVVT